MRRYCAAGCVLLGLLLPDLGAEAQWAPGQLVRIVVPFPAGGPGDVLARLLADQISETTRQKLLVEPRPGGGSVIATEAVARAPPDGGTLLLVANSFLINASLKASLPYDPLSSFAPICLLAHTPLVLVVNSGSDYHSLDEFVVAGREAGGRISVGGTGPSTTQHVAIEALKLATGADMTFVPFSGDPAAINSLLGGHITAALANYTSVRGHLGGALRALAVGSQTRLAELPDVPTFVESGFKEIDAVAWMGMVLPAKTPDHQTAAIASHFRLALDSEQIKAKLKTIGLAPAGICGPEFGMYLREQYQRTIRIVRATKMNAE